VGDWHGGRLLLRSARLSSVRSAALVIAGLRGGAVRRWERDACRWTQGGNLIDIASGWDIIGADVVRRGHGGCGHGAVQVASSAGRWRDKPGWQLAWRSLVATQRKGQLGKVCVAGQRWASWWGCSPPDGLPSGQA